MHFKLLFLSIRMFFIDLAIWLCRYILRRVLSYKSTHPSEWELRLIRLTFMLAHKFSILDRKWKKIRLTLDQAER